MSAQCFCVCVTALSLSKKLALGICSFTKHEQLENFRKNITKPSVRTANHAIHPACNFFCPNLTYFTIFNPADVFFYVSGAVTLLIYHRLFHLKVGDLLSAETWR